MQRNFLKIAEECSKRGYRVTVYTLEWLGEKPEFLKIVIIKTDAIRNIKKYQFFSRWINENLKHESLDLVIGFNNMPGLDIDYCGDPCYE